MEITHYEEIEIKESKSLLEDLKTLKLVLPAILNNMDVAEDITKLIKNG